MEERACRRTVVQSRRVALLAWSPALNSMNGLSARARLLRQSNRGSAALLAQLEAKNAVLRHRAAELALNIQKLAEKSE
jgi:cell division protein FtsB